MVNATISAVIAVKDEEIIIERCLKHIQWVDEIIIIDNGSSDRTVSICKKYTKNVFSIKGNILIPELQQKGIEKATKEWVIILDADVLVTSNAAGEIREQIQKKNYDGFYLIHKNYFLGSPLRSHFSSHKILKLFRRKAAFFEGKTAHEAVTFLGNRVGTIKNYLIHDTHPNIKIFLRKINKYSSQDAYKLSQGDKAGIMCTQIKHISWINFIFTPLLYFINFFLRRRAFLDGVRGFIQSVIFSLYVFLERAKLYEININKEQNTQLKHRKL